MAQQGLFQKASLLATITSLWTSRNALSRTASCRLPGKLCRGCASVVQRRAKERQLARAQTAWSKECVAGRLLTSRISKAATASVLIALLDSAVDQQGFNEYHAGAAFARLAQLKQKKRLSREHLKGHVVLRLQSRLLELISKGILEARGAANTLWAVAVLGLTNTRLLRELVHVVSGTSRNMKPQELANCVWALACLKDSHPLVLQALPRILESLPQKINGMKPQELSNCFWALARLREDEDAAFSMGVRCVAEQASSLADFMGPQDLSNCLWAAAQLCRQADAPDELRKALVPRLVTRLPRVVHRMIPQHLANCLWSSVYLQDVTPEVLQIVPVLAREIPGKAARMNTQELSNCLWAAANLKDISREVLSIVSSVSEGLSESSSCRTLLPQHLSNCLWASAQLKDGPSGREVRKALPAILHSVPSVADMNPQEVANCLWAAAHLQDVRLVLQSVPFLVERLVETLDGMKPQELSSCLMASARLEATAPEVLHLTPLLADASNQLWPRGLRDGV
ncbi:unnamed protein product, partial [Symbiodinium sp. CCMP2456]